MTGEDSYRRRLLKYNEADVRALAAVCDWLRGENSPGQQRVGRATRALRIDSRGAVGRRSQ
jgi:hypothetical protein